MSPFAQSFEALGTTLKLWADFINQLPFFTPQNSISHFKIYHDHYQRLHAAYEASPAYSLECLKDCHENAAIANAQIKDLFQTVIVQLKPEACVIEEVDLKEHFISFLKTYEVFYHSDLSSSQAFLAQKENLEKQFLKILGLLKGMQGAVLKKTTLKHISAQGIIAQSLGKHFDAAKTLQHQLYVLKQFSLDFSCVENPAQKPLAAQAFLRKEAYEELVFLTMLVNPEYVCSCLTNKINRLESNRDQLLSEIKQLRHSMLSKIVRLERTIQIYQTWGQVLREYASTVKSADLTAAFTAQQLLSYDKKAFFKKCLQSQSVFSVFQSIKKTLGDLKLEAPEGLNKVYLELLKRKKRLQQELSTLEQHIKASQTYSQTLLATAILGIQQQPEYQLGQLAATLNAQFLDQFPELPIIGERLPPALLHQLQQAVGLSFLSITLYTSNYFGYSYQLIACLNRILFAQINLWIQVGAYADAMVQATLEPLVDALKRIASPHWALMMDCILNHLRWDELGLLEKEKMLQWLSGLGLHLGLEQSHTFTPAFMGYMVGTTLAETTSAWVEHAALAYDQEEHSVLALKALTHFITYSYAYRLAHQSTLDWWVEAEPLMSQHQAFEILGLGQYAKFKEVHQRYRELAMRYHPDKCQVDCEQASDKMAAFNNAYSVLKKKLV